MNCADCREDLVAYAEGLLGRDGMLQCETHLNSCAACRAEHASIRKLQERLIARGQAAAEVSVVAPVMRRVRAVQIEPEEDSVMTKLITRWRFGLSAAVGATAVVLITFLLFPRTQATAAEVLARGAKAVARLTSIHLRGQLRTAPQDNFAAIMPEQVPVTIELWKQFEPELKWRVEKPGRVAVMDGQSTLMFVKPANLAMKFPKPSPSAFDTQWLHEMANLSETLENELRAIKAHGWPVTLTQERGDDGKMKSVVTVEVKSGLPESDYLKNKFFRTADTRRVYTFDNQSELLESVKIYLHKPSGEQLIFSVNQIDYNQPIDPAVWKLELPTNVNWYQTEMQMLPDNDKYASLSAEQAARAYFEALARGDWTEADKFRRSPVDEGTKQTVAGLEIISVGKAFASADQMYPGRFVPYEVKLKRGDVVEHNIALKKDRKTGRWFVDGGGF